MPNGFAYIALFSWPLVSLWLFATRPAGQAAAISVVVSFLFLPSRTAVDLPFLPALDKVTVSGIALLVLAFAFAGDRMRIVPAGRIPKLLFLLLFGGAVMTMAKNTDILIYGPTILPAQRLYDALSYSIQTLLVVIPFLVGQRLLGSVDGHRTILKVLAISGVVYAALMAFEIRMSPQLHTWIYGFFPHSFGQQMRGDGFRPVVFLIHGLWTAFFAMTAAVSAAALWRASPLDRRGPWLIALVIIGGVLVLARSLGSQVYALCLIPLVLFLSPRAQIRIAVVLAVIAITYPALRGAHLIPTGAILDLAESVSAERAQSLGTRIQNEERLLAKAEERALFGWGIWARNRVYDPETGQDLSITDGYWVILIGTFGWIGYVAIFGLLAWPIVSTWRKSDAQIAPETAALCLLLAITMVELLPNSTFPPWTWLIAGALMVSTRKDAKTEVSMLDEMQPAPRINTVL